jgi:hypothetical protein
MSCAQSALARLASARLPRREALMRAAHGGGPGDRRQEGTLRVAWPKGEDAPATSWPSTLAVEITCALIDGQAAPADCAQLPGAQAGGGLGHCERPGMAGLWRRRSRTLRSWSSGSRRTASLRGGPDPDNTEWQRDAAELTLARQSAGSTAAGRSTLPSMPGLPPGPVARARAMTPQRPLQRQRPHLHRPRRAAEATMVRPVRLNAL